MRASISIHPSLSHVAGEALPDTPVGQDIDDAAYHTVHGYPGGPAALAPRMGVPAGTLTHKANVNNATHHFKPRELVALQQMTGNAAVLQAMAHALGYTCIRAIPDQSDGDPVEATMRMQMAHAEFWRAVADPLAHGRQPSRNEMRRAEQNAADLIATIGDVLAMLRGQMRTAPKVEG